MEDVTVAVPSGRNTLQSPGLWIPYESLSSAQTCPVLPDFTDELHRQRVLLVQIMVPLGYALCVDIMVTQPHPLQY